MRQASREVRSGRLYESVVRQARKPFFYSDLAVPDTIEGRFELVVLHCALVLRRLREGGPALRRLGQPLLEYMFNDFDRSIREIGVGDMSVGKYMKRLGKSFYGRAAAYDKALDSGAGLAEAVERNILGTSEAGPEHAEASAERMARYIRLCREVLSQQSDEGFMDGEASYPSPEDIS